MRVYIILTDTGSLLTRLIKLRTKKPYNHISIAFNDRLTDIYSFGRKKPNNPFIGGFVKEDLATRIFRNAKCAIYSFEVTEAQFLKMQTKVKEMEASKDKYRYNLIGLLAASANLELARKNAYFCSQFVAMVLKEADIHNERNSVYCISPYDIQQYTGLELVYEGSLQTYLIRDVGYVSRLNHLQH